MDYNNEDEGIDRLTSEKEDSAVTGSGGGTYEEIVQLNNNCLNSKITSPKHYMTTQPLYSGNMVAAGEALTEEVEVLRQQVVHLKRHLQASQDTIRSLEQELFLARDLKLKEAELQSGLDTSRESTDREVFNVFTDKELLMENQRLKADLDNMSRQRRHLSERIQRWEEELSREDISSLGEDGLRQELRIAIKTLQIRDHK